MNFHAVALIVLACAMEMDTFDIADRASWDAAPPTEVLTIDKAVPFVIIHHSDVPAACYTSAKCKAAMRSMQFYHQNTRGWADIGYNFAIGGDGVAYEGRGFNVVGAHAPLYNKKSIGICLIGNWMTELPPPEMLDTTQKLIAFAIDAGYLSANYTLLGHRQGRATECPGDRLFNEISRWPHFGTDVPIGPPQ